MSDKGNYYIVYPNGDVYDEFGHCYKYDKPYLIDFEGKKHEIKEKDVIGFYSQCSTPNKEVVFQNFSLSFEVNVSARIARVSNHDGHITPFLPVQNINEPVPADFYDFVKSEFDKTVIVTKWENVCPEVRYDIIPHIEVKIKSKEKNLQHIRKTEEELKLAPLEEDKNLEKLEQLFAEMVLHYETELKPEIRKIISHLYHEVYVKDKDNEVRKSYIANMIQVKDRDIRRRIPIQKGRTPIIQQKDFQTEKQRFINQCFNAFSLLKAKRKKLTRTELAEILFNDSNPMQTLRRKFKSLELTFEDVLQQYTEQKSS